MKVKDIDALREQISHDPREAFTKHQVWLLVSEHNKTTPTFDAVRKSVLQDIKAEIKEWYWQTDKQYLAKDLCVVDAMVDLFIRTIDKHMESEDNSGSNNN